MYMGKLRLRGMGDIGDNSDPYPITFTPMDAPDVYIAPPPVVNDSSGNYYTMPTADSSGTDWAGLFSNAIKAWGTVQVANKQAQVAQSGQQYAYASQLAARGYNPNSLGLPGYTLPAGYTPLPAQRPATSSISPAAILALVGLGAAALYFA